MVASALAALVMLGVPIAASAAPASPADPAPAPAAAAPSLAAGSMIAMSCPTSKTCVGIGSTSGETGGTSFLRTWNGKAWGPAYGVIPGSASDGLDTLSCLSAAFCVAAGSGPTPGGVGAPAAAVWKGTSWSAVQIAPAPPSKARDAWFNEVSCASAKFCVAVGEYSSPNRLQTPAGFADVWNGTKWTLSWKMPAGTNAAVPTVGELSGVSCRSAVNCVAVGETNKQYTLNLYTNKTYRPIALVWTGRWKQVTPAVPASGHGLLNGVSCWAARGCEVVGAYYPNKADDITPVPLADSWNGSKWVAARPPSAGAAPILGEVSCVSASNCLAVGTSSVQTTTHSFAAVLRGKKWAAVPVAVPPHGGGRTGAYPNSYILDAVSCATASDCVAFGAAGPVRYGFSISTFAEGYNGKRLSVIADS